MARQGPFWDVMEGRASPPPRRSCTASGWSRSTRRGKDVAFMAGELRNGDGEVVPTATATAAIRRG